MFNATLARVVGDGLAQSVAGLGLPASAAGDLARDVGGLLDVAAAKRPFAAVVHCLCEAP
jgi:protease-4